MARKYKQREYFEIICIDCQIPHKTNSYRTLRCGRCAKSSEYLSNMLDVKWRLNKLVSAAKFRSNKKNLSFDIDTEYLVGLWNKSNGRCVISGRDFDLTSWGEKGQVNPNAPSVDRIIPNMGYIKGNVRLVAYHINVALSEYGFENFIDVCQDVINFNKG